MSMMKQFLVVLIASSLAIPALAQRRRSPNARNKAKGRAQAAANRPPIINSFTSSHGTVVIPCPGWVPNAIPCSPNHHTVTLTTDASDPDSDELLYKFSASVGRITGAGSKASWDYRGITPGSYVIKVVVTDQRGGVAAESFTVKVIECPVCDQFCVTISVSCPDNVEEGQPAICTANVSGGGRGIAPTYSWTVSFGRIIKGQGTPEIEVETTGLAGRQVTADLEVGGIPPECSGKASRTIQVGNKGPGLK
jgi:hypothetical protein